VAKLGEKISVKKFVRFKVGEEAGAAAAAAAGGSEPSDGQPPVTAK
jgi:hypothetical protein